MAPKRKKEDLLLKSIWDESLVDAVITNKKHRNRIWQYLIMHPEQDICDIPFLSWSVRRDEAEVLQRDFVRYTSKIMQRNESSRGDSIKLLIELQGTTLPVTTLCYWLLSNFETLLLCLCIHWIDGHRIETVIMKHHAHSTVCVSPSTLLNNQSICSVELLHIYPSSTFFLWHSHACRSLHRSAARWAVASAPLVPWASSVTFRQARYWSNSSMPITLPLYATWSSWGWVNLCKLCYVVFMYAYMLHLWMH